MQIQCFSIYFWRVRWFLSEAFVVYFPVHLCPRHLSYTESQIVNEHMIL